MPQQVISENEKGFTILSNFANNNWVIIQDSRSGQTSQSTGILSGGELTINGGDNTKFDLASGRALIIDNTDPENPVRLVVDIPAVTAGTVTNLATANNTYILVNSAGAVEQQTNFPSDADYRNKIVIGVLTHPNRTTLGGAGSLVFTAYNQSLYIEEFITALGPFKLSGLEISANGTNLNFDLSAGTSLIVGRNYPNNPLEPNKVTSGAQTAPDFVYSYRDGSGGFTVVVPPVTSLNPGQYDDGSGTLQSVSASRYTNQRVYFFPDTGNILVRYGTQLYNSMTDAITGINSENISEDELVAKTGVFVGYP